ncbi:MAG: hypothetical protein MZV63_33475, partial [Marinilabiliales bacterium]|nr:hypothetical protein [Marinilabiliales bacterium]
MDYVEVPVLLRVSLPRGRAPLEVRLLAGPVASLKVDEKLSTTGLIGYSLDFRTRSRRRTSASPPGPRSRMRTAAISRWSARGATPSGSRTSPTCLRSRASRFGGDVKNGSFYLMAGTERVLSIPFVVVCLTLAIRN